MRRDRLVAMITLLGLCWSAGAQEDTAPAQYLVTMYSFRALDDAWTGPRIPMLVDDIVIKDGEYTWSVGDQTLTFEDGKALWDGAPKPTDPRIVPVCAPSLMVLQDEQATIVAREEPPSYLEPSDQEDTYVRKVLDKAPWFRLSVTVSPKRDTHVQVAFEQEVSLIVGRKKLPGVALDVGVPITATSSISGTMLRVPLGHWLCMAIDKQGHLVTLLQVTQGQDAPYPTLEASPPQLDEAGKPAGPLQYTAETKVLRVPAASSSEVADALVSQPDQPDDGVKAFDAVRLVLGFDEYTTRETVPDKPGVVQTQTISKPQSEELTTIKQVIEWLDGFEGVELVTAPRVTALAFENERTSDDWPRKLRLPTLLGRSSWPPPQLGECRSKPAIVIDTRSMALGMEHVAASSEPPEASLSIPSRETPLTVWYGTAMSFWCKPSFWENPSEDEDSLDIGCGYHHRSQEAQQGQWWQWKQPLQVEEFSFYRQSRIPKGGWVGFTYEMATTGDRIVILLTVRQHGSVIPESG